MDITLTPHLNLSIDLDRHHTIASLADFLTDQDITAAILEALVEYLDEVLVEALCGEKHANGNGDKRFQRAATTTRSATTTAGEHEFALTYVEDTATSQDEDSHFRPLEDAITFDGEKHYQEDIAANSVDLATTLSYREAASHDGDGSKPSPVTILRRVKEYGSNLNEALSNWLSGTAADTVVPDGTKCYSQDDDRTYHDVQVTLEEDITEDTTSLLDVSVNADWNETAAALGTIDVITDDCRVVSDAEQRIVDAFTDDTRIHQLDLVHVPRSLSYKLWEDDAFALEERQQIVSEVADDVFHLKNSVETHRPEGERSAIRSRIARTTERIRKTAWQLEQLASPNAAAYLRRGLPSMVTFAEYALAGIEVPWTSNPVERAMGEVAKRCKRDWMRWTEDGLEALLQLLLVKYANPDHYREFFDDLLQRSAHTTMNCTVSVTATGGEL